MEPSLLRSAPDEDSVETPQACCSPTGQNAAFGEDVSSRSPSEAQGRDAPLGRAYDSSKLSPVLCQWDVIRELLFWMTDGLYDKVNNVHHRGPQNDRR